MTIRCLPRWTALFLLGALAVYAAPLPAADTVAEKRAAESEARLKKDIFYLASDELEGRGPTTKGIEKAADYIANEFKKAGLKGGGADGSYFQPFTTPGSVQDAPAVLKLKGPKGQEIELKEGEQFYAMGLGYAGKATGAAVVFAGYGTATTNWKINDKTTIQYDDYAGMDIEDKVVIALRDTPRSQRQRGCLPAGSRLPVSETCARRCREGEGGSSSVRQQLRHRQGWRRLARFQLHRHRQQHRENSGVSHQA